MKTFNLDFLSSP